MSLPRKTPGMMPTLALFKNFFGAWNEPNPSDPRSEQAKKISPKNVEGPQVPEKTGNIDWVSCAEEVNPETFTLGAARLVNGHDGSKACPALVPSYELIWTIQNAIVAKQGTQNLIALSEARDAEMDEREQELIASRMRSDRECRRITKKVASLDQPSEEQEERLHELRQAIEEIDAEIASFSVEKQQMADQIAGSDQQRQQFENEVFLILEDVCVKANLLPVQTPFGEENEAMAEQHESAEEIPSIGADIIPAQRNGATKPDGAHEEQNEGVFQGEVAAPAAEALSTRMDQNYQAQRAFDEHQATYSAQLDQYIRAQINRPNVDFQAEFDLIYLQQGRDITGKLLEAERALEQAKIEAKAAGVEPTWDQESNFIDYHDDGYKLSGVMRHAAASVDRSRIGSWLEAEMEPPEDVATVVSEYDTRSDINGSLFESQSVIDQTTKRRKIDFLAQEWRGGHH